MHDRNMIQISLTNLSDNVTLGQTSMIPSDISITSRLVSKSIISAEFAYSVLGCSDNPGMPMSASNVAALMHTTNIRRQTTETIATEADGRTI